MRKKKKDDDEGDTGQENMKKKKKVMEKMQIQKMNIVMKTQNISKNKKYKRERCRKSR